MKLLARLTTVGLVAASSPAWAAVGESITKPMRYSACLAFISQTAQISGATPVNIIETSSLRVVRIQAQDGSVLLTCDKEKGTMMLVPSSSKCGEDVNC